MAAAFRVLYPDLPANFDLAEGNGAFENTSVLLGISCGASGDPRVNSDLQECTGAGSDSSNAYDTNSNATHKSVSNDADGDQPRDGYRPTNRVALCLIS